MHIELRLYVLIYYFISKIQNQLDRYINPFRYVYNWGIAKEREIYEQYQNGLKRYKNISQQT